MPQCKKPKAHGPPIPQEPEVDPNEEGEPDPDPTPPPEPPPPPAPTGDEKAIARGVFTRDNMPPAGTPVRIATKKVYWKDIEPSQGSKSRTPILSVLDQAQGRGLEGVRLRPTLGAYAPTWAKNLANGPITMFESQGGTSFTMPDLWSPEYQTAVESLFTWMATQFDNDPRVLAVFASGAMTYYAEPFIRNINTQQNRDNMLAAGYTRAEDEALQKWQLDIMSGFTKTPIGLAYNPFQFVNANGSAGSSLAYTAEVMDYHLGAFGVRTILQNNSIRSSYIASPPPLYAEFLSRLSEPGTTSYQVAGATRVGNADATMNWAIDYLEASGVELVNGYTNFHTNAELADYDARLRAQTQ